MVLACASAGKSRKVSLIFITLAVASWVCFLAGFIRLGPARAPPSLLTSGEFYPHWMVVVEGIPLGILAVVQTVISKPGEIAKILTAITTVFSILYINALGMVLYLSGFQLALTPSVGDPSNTDFEPAFPLLLIGSFSCTVFWGLLMMMWPFFNYNED